MTRILSIEPELGTAFAGLLARRLFRSSKRMSTSIVYPLEYNLLQALLARLHGHERIGPIEDAMEYNPDIRPLLRKELAEYLGHSERHINRILHELVHERIVTVDGQVILGVDKTGAMKRLLELEE